MSAEPNRRLNWLLGSNAFANLGDGIAKTAFPLLAATVTRDPLLIAGLSAAQFLPWLLFGLLAGAMLDRVDRRKAVVLANRLLMTAAEFDTATGGVDPPQGEFATIKVLSSQGTRTLSAEEQEQYWKAAHV